MKDETILDLKQYIAATVSQEISDVRFDISILDKKIDAAASNLGVKIDDLSQSIADALGVSNKVIDDQLKYHEQRISKLEQNTA